MTIKREGFHNAMVQIPDVCWAALSAEADRSDESVSRILARILQRHYKIKAESMPRLKRPGRPPKSVVKQKS